MENDLTTHEGDETSALLRALHRKHKVDSAVPFTAMDYIHAKGSPLDAWMYSQLFWPPFRELDGMVVLRDSIEDVADAARARDALLRHSGDTKAAQQELNRFEVSSFFGRLVGDTSAEEDASLAQIIARTWRAKLREEYPGRGHVSVEPADDNTGVTVVFWVDS